MMRSACGRSLVRLGVCVLTAVIGVGAANPQAAATAKPNIIIVLADDLTWHEIGCFGGQNAKTPNIDKLATQGMKFTHCFTATAMCAPTRQQLYTGVFPVRNGAYPNHSKVYPGTKSIVHHLRALGYRVGLAGKKHFGPGASFPFDNVGGGDIKLDAIRAFLNADKAQPYCLVVTSHSPHLPWSAGDASRYDAAKLKLPPYLVDTPETRVSLTKYYAEVTDFDREVGEVVELVDKSGRADDTIVIVTSEQGGQFPRGKWTCYDTGVRVGFVVRWPSKVKAGAVSDALVQYVDVVPTLVEAAGGDPAKIDTGLDGAPGGGRGFDGSSFLAVLEGKTDKHHDYVFGCHTTRGIINGSKSYPIRSIRTETHKYIWNVNHEAAFQNVVLGDRDRSGYWGSWVEKAKTDATARRFVEGYQHRPMEELYDLHDDPYELNNLAGKPELAELKADLRQRLLVWMKQQGDQGEATELAATQRQGRGSD